MLLTTAGKAGEVANIRKELAALQTFEAQLRAAIVPAAIAKLEAQLAIIENKLSAELAKAVGGGFI
jgi:hypothetical protein